MAEPMAPDLKSGSRIRTPIVTSRESFIEARCRVAGRIAHLGCTDSPYTQHRLATHGLLHERLLAVGDVVGFDIDSSALRCLDAAFPDARFVCADVTVAVPEEWHGRFQLVIAGEVLEHVPSAGAFLVGARKLLAPSGHLLVTVPNACSPKIGIRSLLGRESVHPDHHTYYGPRTLERALRSAGYQLESMATYLAKPSPVGQGVNAVLRLVNTVTHGPVGDGLIAVARATAASALPPSAQEPPRKADKTAV